MWRSAGSGSPALRECPRQCVARGWGVGIAMSVKGAPTTPAFVESPWNRPDSGS